MKRRISALATLTLATAVIVLPPANAATAKAGALCSKVGGTSIVSGIKYTCVKSGKKFIWSKGSKVSKQVPKPVPTASATSMPTATPTPTPTPTATTKTFKAQIPIPLPVAQNGLLTFSNLSSKFADIPQTSWQRVQDSLAVNPTSLNVNNDIHLGPNTKIVIDGGLDRIKELLDRTQRIFTGFIQVSNFSMLIYNSIDEPWAEKEWETFATARKYFEGQIRGQKRTIAGNCQSTISPGVFSGGIENCGGADSSAIQNKDDAILTLGQSNSGGNGDSGETVSHEYVHAVQAAQWIGNPKVYCTESTNSPDCFRSHWVNNTLPCWLNEGLANSVGYIIAGDTFAKYQTLRARLPFNQGPTTVTDYTERSLKNFLYGQVIGDNGCISSGPIYRLGYSVGALTTEALIAIGGVQSVMSVYALCAEGKDFPSAFNDVYGITWGEASSILAKTLALEYETYGPPPK